MSIEPLISVCIPMYNNGATISRCIGSVLIQEGVDFEIVVVDDDSSDDCVAIAANLLRLGDRLVRNTPRLGLNGNHNKCLKLARGTLVQFVHGDDALLPGALQTLSECFADPAVGLAFAPREVVSHSAEWELFCGTLHDRFRTLHALNHGPSLVAQMVRAGLKLNWIGEPTSVMIRRRIALDSGGWRSDIYNLVDLDLWLRVMLRSSVCFAPHAQSVRHHTASTASTRNAASQRDWLDRLRILTWMVVDPASTPIIRIMAGMWWFPAWMGLVVRVVMHGPSRWRRIGKLCLVPVVEFAHAGRLRRRNLRPELGHLA
jgi:glycosyltransferase involved in cell wall biosynthesis